LRKPSRWGKLTGVEGPTVSGVRAERVAEEYSEGVMRAGGWRGLGASAAFFSSSVCSFAGSSEMGVESSCCSWGSGVSFVSSSRDVTAVLAAASTAEPCPGTCLLLKFATAALAESSFFCWMSACSASETGSGSGSFGALAGPSHPSWRPLTYSFHVCCQQPNLQPRPQDHPRRTSAS
jgi:hypothetical protein